MKTQLYHVFRTYWNRPLLLLLGFSMLVLTALLFFHSTRNKNFSIEPKFNKPNARFVFTGKWDRFINGKWVKDKTGGWEEFINTEDLKEIEALILHVERNADTPDLSQLTELQSLEIHLSEPNPELLKQIQSMKKLTSLSFRSTEYSMHSADRIFDLPEAFLKNLGPQLLKLDISLAIPSLFSDFKEREYLSNLELLKIAGRDVSQETITAISALPNLKTLVIDTSVMLNGPQGELLLPLKKHPTLKRIYANWYPQDDHWYGETALSPIQLLPSSYSRGKGTAIMMASFLMGLLLLMLFLQLWSQFISSGAMVIPGYAKAHRRAALLLLCGVSLVAVIGIVLTGVALLPAITLTLAIPAGIGLVSIFLHSRSQTMQTLGGVLAFMVGAAVVGLMSILNTPLIAVYYIWFLQGYYSILASFLLMTELGILAIAFRRLPEITRYVNEQFAVTPGISPWDVKQQQRAYYGRDRASQWQVKMFDFHSRDVQFHQGSMWKQMKLWRLGNTYRPLRFMLMMGGILILFLVGGELIRSGWANGISFNFAFRPILGMLAFQISLAIMFIPVTFWFRRYKELELETMRPVSRKDLVHQLFLSLGLDQSCAFAVGIFLLLLAMFLPGAELSREEIIHYSLFFVAAVLWIYAISTTVIAIRRAWVFVAVGIGASLALIAVLLGWNYESLSVRMGSMEMQQQLAIAVSVCIISIPASIGMIIYMYRKALDREWGSK